LQRRARDVAAERVVLDVRYFEFAGRATDVRNVDRDRRARQPQIADLRRDRRRLARRVRALEVAHVEPDLDVASPRRTKRGGEGVAPIEQRLPVRQRRGARTIEVVEHDRQAEVRIRPPARAERHAEETVVERVTRERALDRPAERERLVQLPRERPREPRVARVAIDEVLGRVRPRREHVVDARRGREPEQERRRGLERVPAVDLVGPVAIDAVVANLPRRNPTEVRGIQANRLRAVLARRAPPERVEPRRALRLRRVGARNGWNCNYRQDKSAKRGLLHTSVAISRRVSASASNIRRTSPRMALSATFCTIGTRKWSSPSTVRRVLPRAAASSRYFPSAWKYFRHSAFTFGRTLHAAECVWIVYVERSSHESISRVTTLLAKTGTGTFTLA